MTYEQAIAARKLIESQLKRAELELDILTGPRGPMGLTREESKTQEWVIVKRQVNEHFRQFQKINSFIVKNFPKEEKEKRENIRKAREGAYRHLQE